MMNSANEFAFAQATLRQKYSLTVISADDKEKEGAAQRFMESLRNLQVCGGLDTVYLELFRVFGDFEK